MRGYTPGQTARRALATLVAAFAASGCGAASANEATDGFPQATMLLDSAAGTLKLEPIDALRLGTVDSARVGRVTHLLPTGDRIYVVDGIGKRVLAFDRHGTLVARLGKPGVEIDQYEDPYRVAVRGDSVFVLDLARFSHVPTFDPRGNYVGGVNWKNEQRMPTDLHVSASGMFVSTTAKPEKGSVADVLHMLGSKGETRGTGCRVDPRIVQSDRAQGMLGALVFAGVSVLGDRVYCSQATTPVVQVMDTAGRTLSPITIAPPFYVGPVDRPLTMNTKHMMAFNASFTTHLSFVPTQAGFVSTYSRYDTTTQHARYLLFACDSAHGPRRCGTLETAQRVLHVAAPDTLYLEEPRTASAVVVGRYRLRLEGR